ncbi:MAG: cation:proton antiporter [Rubrobacteraceae bacterium]
MSLPEWLLLLSVLLSAAVLLGLLAARVRLPLTVVLAVVGFLAAWLGGPLGFEMPLEGQEFEEVLIFVFLPVLVFAAALGLSTRAFLNNLGPIFVLATLALLASAALVGVSLYLVLGIPLVAALLFGALISATDPVAVVAIFRKLGVPRRLLTLVEGESLLNDGIAIVLFNVLLLAALGREVSLLGGVLDFFSVFLGGAAIGCALGFLAALVLPRLDRFPAAALSMALAYGGFVLADYVLGFSGVMATVAAGLVLGGLAPSRASSAVRELWEQLWDSLGYIANALLFLLIGLSIDPELIAGNLGAIALAIVVVCVARAAAVLPLMSVLERFAHIPPVGWRNEAVLIWGGLRGGVALALALSLPESLPQREVFVAMTGGVVLATLLLNATTISTLVHRLGLDRPTAAERFLADFAVVSAVERSRWRLKELGFEDPELQARLADIESGAWEEVKKTELSAEEKVVVLVRRGLSIERATYQHLRDAALIPVSTARALLHEVDDQLEASDLGNISMEEMESTRGQRSLPDRLIHRLSNLLPPATPEAHEKLAYDEAGARRLGARQAYKSLDAFLGLPNMEAPVVHEAKEIFERWEKEALAILSGLDSEFEAGAPGLRHRRAEALSRLSALDALHELAEKGLLPEDLADRAAASLQARIRTKDDP